MHEEMLGSNVKGVVFLNISLEIDSMVMNVNEEYLDPFLTFCLTF